MFTFGDACAIACAGSKNLGPEQMRVNVLVGAARFHVDTLDVYSAKARAVYSEGGGRNWAQGRHA